MESMNRQAPRPEKPLTAEEVVAQNQRERAARQAGKRRLSPSSPKTDASKQGGQAGTTGAGGATAGTASKAGDDSDGEGSGSEGEDGYMSSSSSSSLDQRSPSHVRQDVLSEVHGSSDRTSNKGQNVSHPVGEETGQNGSSNGVPQSLKPESHENIIYLAGNSLGLQSKSSYQLVNEELMMWQTK